jgi:dual specificity phosphatase 12
MDSTLTMSSAVADDDDDDDDDDEKSPEQIHAEVAKFLGRRLSDAMMTPAPESNKDIPSTSDTIPSAGAPEALLAPNEASAAIQEPITTHLISPTNLAAHLYASPKLASLRSPSFSSSLPTSPTVAPSLPIISAPIVVNPKCSGYFVEPVRF